jgi:FkbH-like protein
MIDGYLSAKVKAAANRNIKERDYWLNQLTGKIEKSYFPYDKEQTGQAEQTGPSFANVSFGFPGEITARLLQLTRQSDYALHIYLAAGVVLLLHHYTGMEDILVGTPIYKQDIDREFINRVILLRNRLKDNMTVKELLIEVRQTIAEAVEHQNYPIEMLPEQLNLSNDEADSGFPLFDIAMLLENLQDKKYLAQITHNMQFSFSRNDGSLMGNIEYNSQLYEKATVERIGRHFIGLMEQALDNLDSCIARLKVLPGEERQKNIKWLSKKKERAVLIPPRGPYQEKLAEIWSEILKVEKERIGIDTNFFKMGGHSLKASRLVMRILRDFDVRIPLSTVFAAPFIRTLAREIAEAKEKSLSGEVETGKYANLGTVEKKEYHPLSSAQARLFILEQQGDLGTTYNMLNAIELKGLLHADTLEKAFRTLVDRHESLRTSFHWINGEPVQRVIINPVFNIESYDISQPGNKKSQKDLEPVLKDFLRPFKLDRGPLFRVGLVKIRPRGNEHILLVDMHHIISDGISMGILVREFAGLYKGEKLQQLHVQYKDFTQWEHQFFETLAFNQQAKFWKESLNGQLPRLPMPIDFKRPEKQSFAGSEITFTISTRQKEQINILAEENNVTLNILVLSIYFLLLHKYTNQEDIIVGSLVSGRNHPDLAHMIGMFGNFLPIRNRIEPGHSFSRFLAASRERIAAVYGNQDYPFEKIIDLLEVSIDLSRNPIFDTMLIFHNEIELSFHLDIPGLDASAYPLARTTSKLDFKLDVFPAVEANGSMRFSLEYNTDLFKKQTMQRFIKHFKHLIRMVTAHPERKISEIEIFSAEEKQDLSGKRKLNTLKTVTQKKPVQLVVSATFTPGPMEEYILWWGKQFGLEIEIAIAPYNQVFQQLLEEKSLLSANAGSDSSGINLLLIRFEDWTRDLDLDDDGKCAKLEKDFRELERIIRHKQISSPYLVGLFPVSTHLSLSTRLVNYLEELNRRWKKLVEETANFYQLDFTTLGQRYQIGEVFDPVMDKEGHLPFTHEYYAALGTHTARTICALVSSPFKVIVLDGDNTLWQGICGEDGPLGVKVQPPYLELQRLMLQKHDQGMLLTLCSKNNPTDVWDVFEKNPGMLLTKDHFVDWKINWQPKSKNIKELAAQLNLGLDSFIFIDDSAVECTEVITNCPEVLTLQLPANPGHIPFFLEHIWALDKMMVTPEDKMRTRMYRADKKRKEIQEQAPSLTEFLSQLELKVSFNIMNSTQVNRVSQLTQRTNQFNLSTRRRREDEMMALAETPGTSCWVLEVSDRFGDYGLVGVVITMERNDHLFIDTFLLSCRVLGRGVENAVLTCLGKYLQESDLPGIKADYYPTPKNKPILEFLQRTWESEEQTGNYTTYSLKKEVIPTAPAYAEIYYRTTLPKPVQPHRGQDNHREISLDHIAVAVKEMEQARSYYRTIGYSCGEIFTDNRQNVRLSMCRQPGYDNLELVSAIDRQSPTAVLVEQNRDIPYHLCYRVQDINQTLTALREQEISFEVVSDSKPAVLLDNKNVIFIQVGQVGLVEFLEDKDGKTGITDEQTNRHNTLRMVVAEPGPAVKFYRYLGYTTVAKHEDNEKLIITMSKPGAGHIELTIPGERAKEERQFLQQNGPHPFGLVFYGSLPGKEGEGFVPYPYTLFKPREQEPGNEKQTKSAPGPTIDLDVYGLDREDWLYRPHLLPLQYCTAGKLLQLPTYQVDKTRFAMGEYEEPQNELQHRLEQVWQDILKLEKIGINLSFFAAGGNSLKAILMVSKLGKELNVQLTLKEVFDHPTIKKLAQYITGYAKKTGFYSIEPVEKKEYYVLSSGQQRLYFLQQMDKDSTAYNIASIMILEGIVDKNKLERSFRGLIQGHESLRTSIEIIEEEPVQLIHEHVEFEIEYKEVEVKVEDGDSEGTRGLAPLPLEPVARDSQPAADIISSFIRPFDLSRPPLLRVGLVKLLHTPTALPGHLSKEGGKEKYIFLVDMHHIISDGMSSQVLVQDFSALYTGKVLAGIKLQYKDYTQWQKRERVSKEILEQGEYWKREYEGEIPVLELPTDYARPEVQGFEGSSIDFEINKETSGAIKALVQETQTTLFIVLLAFYTIFLSKLSSQEDIVIGTPVLGRRHADLEKIIGMFVNTLALRNYPGGGKKFVDFLGEVKERTLKSLENQGYPYEVLVEKVAVKRDVSRNPLFDTLFVLQDTGTQKIEIPGMKLVPYEYENKTSKFDLSLTGVEVEEKLLFTFEYSTKLFKRGTIERFIVYFKNIVGSIVENRNQRIFDIEIITEEERRRVLFDFNDTYVEYPKDKTIHQLFEEQAAQKPDQVALVGVHQTHEKHKKKYNESYTSNKSYISYMSYKELNEKAHQLAHLLQEKGVLPDNIVGIMMERSIEMISGIFGILCKNIADIGRDKSRPYTSASFFPPFYPSTLLPFQSFKPGLHHLYLRDNRET